MSDFPHPSPEALALAARLSGAELPPGRLAEVLAAYEPILREIAKLRALDLRDVHPAVRFDPLPAGGSRP